MIRILLSYNKIVPYLILLCFLSHATKSFGQKEVGKDSDSLYKICLFDICFKTDIPKIDSIEEWDYDLADTNGKGALLWVFDISKENISSLKKECKKSGFKSMPIILIDKKVFIIYGKHLSRKDKGYYKLTERHNRHYTRLEILDVTQKKYIVYIFN